MTPSACLVSWPFRLKLRFIFIGKETLKKKRGISPIKWDRESEDPVSKTDKGEKGGEQQDKAKKENGDTEDKEAEKEADRGKKTWAENVKMKFVLYA